MARDRSSPPMQDAVISIIGPGMTVVGDCETDGTLRIEGRVEGTIRAGKAVVVGKEGEVEGKIFTQDAVLGGRVVGAVHAASRLEVQATARIDAEVRARRMQLEEGAEVNGSLTMGEKAVADVRAGEKPGPRKVDDSTPGAKKAG
ncbi:bactofilin family protein [Gaopeijia maritima]|uniref:Polymer-forming cytoskeletal protein n=1 Tax=Gaopeijia maritima TaxID=3119007 RepID=A0ABU9E734_9BACT